MHSSNTIPSTESCSSTTTASSSPPPSITEYYYYCLLLRRRYRTNSLPKKIPAFIRFPARDSVLLQLLLPLLLDRVDVPILIPNFYHTTRPSTSSSPGHTHTHSSTPINSLPSRPHRSDVACLILMIFFRCLFPVSLFLSISPLPLVHSMTLSSQSTTLVPF